MDLKGILPKKGEEKEHYWSVVIESEWVQSGIWKVEEGKVEVVSFGAPLSWQKDQDLVETIDSSLSVAIQNLADEEIEPSKTVFGLPSSWVENGQIKPQYQEQIKKVCEELSLKPVGFVSLTEAIAYYLKSQEGDFLSATIVAIGEEDLGVSLVVRGETKGEAQVSRSVSLVEDLVEGLSRFSFNEPLPARIILYDGREGELEDLRQSLISVDWDSYQTIKFLHPPKIEIIRPEEKVLATSLAGGVELEGAKEVEVAGGEREEKREPKVETEVKEDNFERVDEDLGFVVGEDIKKVSEDVMGIPLQEEKPVAIESENREEYEVSKVSPVKAFINKLKGLLPKKEKKVLAGPRYAFDKKPLIFGLLAFLAFLVGGFLAWWFLPTADVKIYVSPQKIEESVDLKLDKNISSLDVSSRILSAREVKKEIKGEKTISVTGTKVVGDKAKGKVQIYRTGDELKLTKGTKLQSSSGLVFTLDDDVEVASGSASTPSKTEASVTAFDIGAEYNLASGESFSVGNYALSTIEAKNEEAFSGGSSREISAVSAKDYDSVLSDLKKELEDKLFSDIESSLNENKIMVKESIKDEIKDKTYNHKIGDEASDLKLNLTLSATVLVVNKNDFYEVAKEILKEKIPSGYSLRQDQLKASFSLVEEKDGTASFKTNFIANLLPKVDQDEIAKSIAGRSIDAAKEFLVKVRGYDRAEITIKPDFKLSKLVVLPHSYKRIHIEVQASP
ncbi:MAG: hypothetical protein CH104c_0579 [Candidatus Woesebacteria bacterium]|nr:MAG: hypothetical protein CH104c_0579 [Candidatus Woesebacteria bacterium]